MKLRQPILLLAASLVLGGCSTISSWFSKAYVEPMAELTKFTPSAQLEQVWRVSVGSAGKALIQPASAGDAIYVASGGGDVYRIEGGRTIWRASTKEDVVAGVGASGALVAVGIKGGQVATFEADTGKPRWSVDVGGEVSAAPLVDGDAIVVRVGDAKLVSLDAADGRKRWTYTRTTPPLSLRAFSDVRRADAYLFAGFSGGRVAAITANTGQLAWEGAVTQPRGTTELERLSNVVGAPVLAPGMLCGGAYQGRVTCFDLNKGLSVWGRDISTAVGIALDGTRVFVTDERSLVHALDRNTGATLWKLDELKLRKVGRPLDFDPYIAVGDLEGYIHLLNKADGQFAGRARADNSPIDAPLLAHDNGIVALSRDGVLSYMKVR
ncbi:outer membrane protein assembly factor BamB [Niveibacterium sp. 24ML]|uniref:outer membrane protein assembly factor BamB n=1 Tax=Niveibacterium sp. 24ML TaxID=2985512 RepID=UPI0022711E18|nr:outer membrane protein assembly factor BamB [Niveibacterium sp. 24ML]MCX9155096.1 outer membrane protein assembly factor BamB [Niveibacterium sp. 24ML]